MSLSRSVAQVPPLTSLGLSAQADLAYRELATRGGRRLADLSRSLGLPPRQVRQVLDELADIGAAAPVPRPGRPARAALAWTAAAPEQVAAEVHARQREAAAARHRLHRRLASLADLAPEPPPAASRLFSSATSAQARLVELVHAERREHLSMSPERAFSPSAVHAAAPAHRLLLQGKVAVRELGVPPAPEDASEYLFGELSASGARFRELPSLPARLLLFDRATALVRLDPADPRRGALEITDPATVAALVGVFFRHWDRAQDQHRPRPPALTSRELAVVEALTATRTDAAAAAALGLSVRTVAYTVRELMIRFGATNRFQLGLALGPLLTAGPGPTTVTEPSADPSGRQPTGRSLPSDPTEGNSR